MKILTFAATNSRNSINRALLAHASDRLADILPGADIETLDLNDFEMPIYSVDRENESGIPAQARDFYDRVGAADALLISFAEHNGSSTAAWKNVFDWVSRIEMKLFQSKPMVILAASPGPRAGAGVLGSQETLIPHFGGNIVAKLGIGGWKDAWDAEAQKLVRPQDIAALGRTLSALEATPVEKE
jgi:NAD(P)H-dependent FMN reductase